MSAGDIDFILHLWATSLAAHHESPPFSNHTEMYSAIDSTPLGDVPWESFSLEYGSEVPEDNRMNDLRSNCCFVERVHWCPGAIIMGASFSTADLFLEEWGGIMD